MRHVLAAAAMIAALSLAWIAGEHHRRHCVQEGRSGCTVLPWSGDRHQASTSPYIDSVDLDEIRDLINRRP